MSLVLFGVNHNTAPVEVRERLAISPGRLADATRSLVGRPGVREGMILSTCNRVELLTYQELGGNGVGADLLGFLHEYFAVQPSVIEPHMYEFRGGEAVRHLFRVAASLDSMVVGESQILGQVKESYTVARGVGAVQGSLDGLMQRAFTVAKRVRTETAIGSSSVSIASVAVDLAKKIFGSLEGKQVLLVGAGKMSELAARHLMAQGASAILVSNRTEARAEKIAEEFGGTVVPFELLEREAHRADIVITSTGSVTPIFKQSHARKFLRARRGRPMFFIDIAVPRDVDPKMHTVEGIFVYDIDDLQGVAANNMAERGREAEAAEQIVSSEVEKYQKRMQTLDAVPAIVRMQAGAEAMRAAELKRAQAKMGVVSAEQAAAMDEMSRAMMKKMLHGPLMGIRRAAERGDAEAMAAVEKMFLRGDEDA